MTSLPVLLGQLEGLNPLNPTQPLGKSGGLLLRDVLVIVATGLLLALVLVLWARWYVKRRRHHRHESRSAVAPTIEVDEEAGHPPRHHHHHHHRHRHRRRRRHEEFRTRNPTLAETGGLPPARPDPPPTQPA